MVTPRVTQSHEIADTIQEDALKQAHAKLAPFQRSLDLEALFQRHDFFDGFKYSVAKSVSNVIADHDSNAKAFYLFDPSTNPDVETGEYLPMEATIHLLLLVERPSAGLEAFIASLDRALTQSLKALPSPMLATTSSILNIILITEEDIKHRRGYAALILSLFAPPLKIWSRD